MTTKRKLILLHSDKALLRMKVLLETKRIKDGEKMNAAGR